MKLTREQAITEFKKEWNYIADKIERSKKINNINNIVRLKEEYCVNNKCINIRNYCFACEYAKNDCGDCPIDWKSSATHTMCLDKESYGDDKGYYSLMLEAKTWQEQAKLARQIANLPERG